MIAFIILPGGNVLSGNEFGDLLLWEGQCIKCRFTRPGGLTCHAQEVTSIHFDAESNTVVSACMGGWIRWWALEDVDDAEMDKFGNIDVEIDPLHELHAGSGVAIQCLEPGKGNFLIIDANGGALHRLSMPLCADTEQCMQHRASIKGTTCETSLQILELFHAGGITAMDLSHSGAIVVTAGQDGTLRFWNFVMKQLLLSLRFSSAIQCLHWSNQSILFVGFADGTLRLLTFSIEADGSPLSSVLHTTKPHESAISTLSGSPCSGYFATGGTDRTIFLFNAIAAERSATVVDSFQLLPLGFVVTCGVPLCLSWHSDSQHLLCALNAKGRSGVVMELFIGDGGLENIDTTASYDISEVIQTREYKAITPRFSDLYGTESTLALCSAGNNQTPLNEEINAVPYNKDTTDVAFRAKEGSASSGVQQNTQVNGAHDKDFNFRNTDTPPVLSVLYQRSDKGTTTSLGRKFLLTCGGWAAGYVFECDWDSECPPQIVAFPPPQPKSSAFTSSVPPVPAIMYMQWCFHDRILVCGTDDGGMVSRSASSKSKMQGFGKVNSHIGGTSVKGYISSDGHWLITTGGDGLVITHSLRANDFLEKAEAVLDTTNGTTCCYNTNNTEGIISSHFSSSAITEDDDDGAATANINLSYTITDNVLEPKLNVTSCAASALSETKEHNRVVVMCNSSSEPHSLQQAKLSCEENNRQREAAAKKNAICAVIELMREEFKCLVREGAGILTSEEMQIDPFITDHLEAKGHDMMAEVRLEMAHIEETIDRQLGNQQQSIVICETSFVFMH